MHRAYYVLLLLLLHIGPNIDLELFRGLLLKWSANRFVCHCHCFVRPAVCLYNEAISGCFAFVNGHFSLIFLNGLFVAFSDDSATVYLCLEVVSGKLVAGGWWISLPLPLERLLIKLENSC